jgi:hypothetical protein
VRDGCTFFQNFANLSGTDIFASHGTLAVSHEIFPAPLVASSSVNPSLVKGLEAPPTPPMITIPMVTADNLPELASAILDPRAPFIILRADIVLQGSPLPPLLRQMRIKGECAFREGQYCRISGAGLSHIFEVNRDERTGGKVCCVTHLSRSRHPDVTQIGSILADVFIMNLNDDKYDH